MFLYLFLRIIIVGCIFFTISFSETSNEFLRRLSLEVFEIEFNISHFFFSISRGDKHFRALNEFFLIIESVEHYWNLGFKGDLVEAVFPVWVCRTRSYWCNTEPEGIPLLCHIGQSVGHTGVLGAPDRNTANVSEPYTQWPFEPFLLHEKVDVQSLSPHIKLS